MKDMLLPLLDVTLQSPSNTFYAHLMVLPTHHNADQNYINTFYHIRKYITSKDLDKERINYHFNNIDQTFSDGLYNQLDIESCFEFIHTIFSNDLDKLYFLKQYLKNHEQKVRKYIKEQHIMK